MSEWLKEKEKMQGYGFAPSSPLNTNNMSTTGSSGGTDYLGYANVAMSGLDAIGGILGARVAKKNYELQRDAFNFNKEMQSATTLANIQNRIAQYKAVNPNADVGYLNDLATRLQSYLPKQPKPQTTPMATPTQQPLGGPTPAPQGQTPVASYDSLSRYGRGV